MLKIVIVAFVVVGILGAFILLSQFDAQKEEFIIGDPGVSPTKIILEEINNGKRFAIAPYPYPVSREREVEASKGSRIVIYAGIKNDAEDNQSHQFVINVTPSLTDAGKWIAFSPEPILIQINKIAFMQISVNIPSDAQTGYYAFTVAACMDKTRSQCNLDNSNWGTPQQVTITVKP